jgi:hypothetical protein
MFALIYPAAIKQRLLGLPESTFLLVKSPFLLVEFQAPQVTAKSPSFLPGICIKMTWPIKWMVVPIKFQNNKLCVHGIPVVTHISIWVHLKLGSPIPTDCPSILLTPLSY